MKNTIVLNKSIWVKWNLCVSGKIAKGETDYQALEISWSLVKSSVRMVPLVRIALYP